MPAQQTVPQGYYWIRELVPNVEWDEATRTIKLPGGPSIPLAATKAVGGKAYVTPEQLSTWYATYYQPPSSVYTPENVQRQAEIFKQVLEPQAQYWKQYLDFALKKATETAEQQRRLAEATYEASRSALQRQETSDWNAIVKSAIARGLGASPLVSYEQRKVAEAYAPQYQQLESKRAAQLANIASQAALAAEELALKGKEMEANWASQMAQYALSELAKEYEKQESYRQNLANFFADLAKRQTEEQWKQKEFGLQEATITGYYQGKPTWEREHGLKKLAQDLAIAQLRAASGGSSGIKLDVPTRQLLKNELINRAQARAAAAWKVVWDANAGKPNRTELATNAGIQEFQNVLAGMMSQNPYYGAVMDTSDISNYALLLRMTVSQSGWTPLWRTANNFYPDDVAFVLSQYQNQIPGKTTKQTGKTAKRQTETVKETVKSSGRLPEGSIFTPTFKGYRPQIEEAFRRFKEIWFPSK